MLKPNAFPSFLSFPLKTLVDEYKSIRLLPELPDSEADRLDEILEIAESNPWLSHLIDEADLEIARQLNLLDQDSINYYEDKQAKLREYLEAELENLAPDSAIHTSRG